MEDLFEKEQQVLERALSHLEAMEHGSLLSPEEFSVLVREYAQILRQLRRITKISDKTTIELNTSNRKLMEQVLYDPLTGIYNRRFLENSLKGIVQKLADGQDVLGVLMIDVDFFKKYNDTYGHRKGDRCLRIVAKALQLGASKWDGFASRYGGEEFAVVLPGHGPKEACAAAEDILQSIRGCRLEHRQNEVANHVTVSIGATAGTPIPEETGERFLLASDKALYRSKQGGRDRYTFIGLKEA